MKFLSTLSLLFLSISFNAQVGVNTTSPSAAFDVMASNANLPSNIDGILVPRLNNFPSINPTVDQQSMLVYLVNDLTNVNINGVAQNYDRGFYYWDNTITNWVSFTPNENWNIDGNDNTISGISFIGTTNDQELDFRVNNILVSRLTELGQFELSSEDKSLFIGFEAGENYDSTTLAEQNVFIGYQAGTNTVSGRDNIAIGTFSLEDNTSGNFNTSVGDEAMQNNVTGSNNTALGNDALRMNNSGNGNTALGTNALSNNTNGNNNIALGNAALNNVTGGNGNIGIGLNVAIGSLNVSNDIIIGTNAHVDSSNNINSIAFGSSSSILGNQNNFTTVIGPSAIINGNDNERSIVLGNQSQMNGSNGRDSVVLGSGATNTSANSSIAIGNSASTLNNGGANTTNAIAVGTNTSVERPNSIAIGNTAVVENISGRNAQNTIAIGTQANSSWNNSIALGSNATTTGANQLRLGGINEFDLNGANLVNASDKRFKYNISRNVPGLDFITRLRPVTYNFDYAKLDIFYNEKQIRGNKEIIETGLIAQEIKDAMIAVNYDFDGLIQPNDESKNIYKVSYIKFVVPLIQAVKEQQELIKSQQTKIQSLENRLNHLEELINQKSNHY